MNGAKVADVQSASLKRNFNAKAVPTMTRDGFNRGIVQGNPDFDIELSIAVDNVLARPKLESIPYTTASVQLTFECGAELFVATDLFIKDASDDSAGIGEEVKTKFTFGALRLIDSVGNSALFIDSISTG